MRGDRNPPIPQGWQIEDTLGSGSCGSVYRVIRQSDGAHAALKVIPIPIDDSEIPVLRSKGYIDETISRILSNRLIEIFDKYDLLAKMNGESNIVSIGDVLYRRYPDGSGCTVSVLMEELTPLCDTLDYSFSEQRAIAIGCDLLKALEAYGRHRLVHGAIKPENVLVSGSGDDGESEELTPADKGAENYIYAFDTKQLWVIAVVRPDICIGRNHAFKRKHASSVVFVCNTNPDSVFFGFAFF